MSEKRKDNSVGGALIKRAKQDEEDNNKALINLSNQRSGTKNAIVGTVKNAYIDQNAKELTLEIIDQAYLWFRSACNATDRP
jgi:hypothetical protein